MDSSPSDRMLRARMSAHRLHALGKTNIRPGTDAFLARFEPRSIRIASFPSRSSARPRKALAQGLLHRARIEVGSSTTLRKRCARKGRKPVAARSGLSASESRSPQHGKVAAGPPTKQKPVGPSVDQSRSPG